MRSGRRHIRLDQKGDCKKTPSTRQRKTTLCARLLHEDAVESMNRLLNNYDDNRANQLMDEVDGQDIVTDQLGHDVGNESEDEPDIV